MFVLKFSAKPFIARSQQCDASDAVSHAISRRACFYLLRHRSISIEITQQNF
ncbi:hypothetical protein ACI8B_240113 [Acinetobacter proteolyticus]|uniref:Uncharacterized protein n=1 Tax=Acinetobacter proteolyticus TaxID=1776741 RepID=A0A653K5V8_9GAMM|nr:hypothetical protein ACI8B_240113 [Acinetobacter proteolyticus]